MIRLIFIAVLLLSSTLGFNQNLNWARTFGGNGYDEGYSAVQLEDSSYVVVGSSSSFYNSNQNLLFFKVDSAGNFLYSNFIDNGLWETGKKILEINEGYFWICGQTNSMGNGGFDGYLVKVDSLGNKISDFTFGGSDWDFLNDMIMLADSSLVLVGETQSFGAGNKDVYIIKTDKNGDTLWTQTYGSSKNDWASSVIIRNDTLLVAGGIGSDLNDTTYAMLLALDLNGSILFENKHGFSKAQYFNDIFIGLPLDKIYMTGSIQHNSGQDAYTVEYNSDYTFIGEVTWGGADGITEINASTNLPGTGYLMHASTTTTPQINPYSPAANVVAVTTYQGGWWLNGFLYGFNGDDFAYDIIPTVDDGILIIGSNADVAIGGRNLLLIKIGAQDSFPPNELDSIYQIHTSIDELKVEELQVFPNPVTEELVINIPDLKKESYQIKVIASNGKIVLKKQLDQNTIDLRLLDRGLYFIQVWTDKRRYQTKIIKN